MDIDITNKQHSLKIPDDIVRKIVSEVLSLERQKCDEVSIYFVDTAEISMLHSKFFNDASTTDCISFPMDDENVEGYRMLGDIFVCPQTALEYAEEHNISPYWEVTLYIVHGLLHLLGYDDIKDKDIVMMREAEKKHMENLQRLSLIFTEDVS